jgi:hypothetical protein
MSALPGAPSILETFRNGVLERFTRFPSKAILEIDEELQCQNMLIRRKIRIAAYLSAQQFDTPKRASRENTPLRTGCLSRNVTRINKIGQISFINRDKQNAYLTIELLNRTWFA